MAGFRFPRLGLIAALLALAGQLALGASVPSPALELSGFGVICHAGGDTGGPPPPSHQAPDCALCPVCATLAVQAPLLAAPPMLPAPRAVRVARRTILPPPTAPPVVALLAAQPRGPPVLA
jgi:hypothetical protein